MLFKILFQLEGLATQWTWQWSSILVNAHVKISLTIHFEACTTTWNHTFEVFPQSMHNFLVVAQLKLISETFRTVFEPAFKNSNSLVNGEMASETRAVLERLCTVVALELFVCSYVAHHMAGILILYVTIETTVSLRAVIHLITYWFFVRLNLH